MSVLQTQIKQHWSPTHAPKSGTVTVSFKVKKNGSLGAKPRVIKSSGLRDLDTAALLAIRDTAPFNPLPDGAPPQVDIEFTFEFKKH